MKIPFGFRKIPKYDYDRDGQFKYNRIKGKDKKIERKKQIKRFIKIDEME